MNNKINRYIGVTLMLMLLAINANADYKIGVLAKRGAAKCIQEWGDTGKYLSEKLQTKVKIIPLKFTAIEPAVKAGTIDFLLANSAFFVEMEKKHGAKAIATLINSRDGKSLNTFGGVVFTTKDSPINSLKDAKGKKFMLVKKSSFGGGQMAWRLFMDKGINPQTDFATVLEGKKHDNVVLSIKNGIADIGTVRTDTLERMHDEKKININDFKIIHEIKDNFPFKRSTQLYPEWPMAALKNTDTDFAKKLSKALIAMPSDSSAAKSAKIVGWTDAADYNSVKDCLKKIKYGAFAN